MKEFSPLKWRGDIVTEGAVNGDVNDVHMVRITPDDGDHKFAVMCAWGLEPKIIPADSIKEGRELAEGALYDFLVAIDADFYPAEEREIVQILREEGRRLRFHEPFSDPQVDGFWERIEARLQTGERYVPKTDEGSGPIANPEPENPS